jgi:hypothetical protein
MGKDVVTQNDWDAIDPLGAPQSRADAIEAELAAPARISALKGERIADEVVECVAELSYRHHPQEPEMLRVTPTELRSIVLSVLAGEALRP